MEDLDQAMQDLDARFTLLRKRLDQYVTALHQRDGIIMELRAQVASLTTERDQARAAQRTEEQRRQLSPAGGKYYSVGDKTLNQQLRDAMITVGITGEQLERILRVVVDITRGAQGLP